MRGSIMTRRVPRQDPIVKHGVAPGQVTAHHHNKVSPFQVLITAGNRIRTERALVTGHGRRHAKSRIRVDIRRPYKAFHELVGDIIVFCQNLSGDIERDTIGPMGSNRL